MGSVLTAILSNNIAIIFIAIVIMTAFPTAMNYLYRSRKSAMDADLKMKMLELGMSASEIERVLMAESDPEDNVKKRQKGINSV
jgi:hypothetical protein